MLPRWLILSQYIVTTAIFFLAVLHGTWDFNNESKHYTLLDFWPCDIIGQCHRNWNLGKLD